MPRIKRTAYSEETLRFNREADEARDKGYCAPRAVAMVTGLPYDVVAAAFAGMGRKHRKGTPFFITEQVLDSYGYKLIELPTWQFLEQYPRPHCDVLKNVTTHHPRRFPGVWKDGESYLLHCRGHIAACVDGTVHDWTVNSAVRVRRIFRVVKMTGA